MNVPAKKTEPIEKTIEDLIVRGDLKDLNPHERTLYVTLLCKSLKLNPLTQPFEYLTLGGKLVLYAKRAATDQLRKINGISVEVVSREITDGLLTVHVRAKDKTGRSDEDFGVVAFKGGGNEFAANAMMKAVTKAKRRVTLSISGLGFLDETEVTSIVGDGELISPQQVNELIAECDELAVDKRKFVQFLGVPSIADITVDRFGDVKAQLQRKREKIERGDAQGEALL